MSRTFVIPLALLGGLLIWQSAHGVSPAKTQSATTSAPATTQSADDASTPTGAARAFFAAIDRGDQPAAESLLLDSPAQKQRLSSALKLSAARHDLEQAIRQKLPDKADALVAQLPPPFVHFVDNTAETIDQSTATLVSTAGADPITLTRSADGKWRIDLLKSPDLDSLLGDSKAVDGAQKALADVAARIRNGQLKTDSDVSEAISEAFAESMTPPMPKK